MKILMTGPGKGHNVQRFLKWFNQRPDEYRLYYHRYNKAEHYPLESFAEVRHISTFDIAGLAQAARKADIIWVHNWTPWPVLYLILRFKRKKAVLNFNFWSERLPREILAADNWKSRFYRNFFAQCDVLQTSWFSVKDLVDQFEHPNSRLMRWGLEEDYFQEVYVNDLSAFSMDFVRSLHEDKFKFFVPKSIGFPNRHDLIVKAAKMLIDKGITEFVIYFWKGNRVENRYELEILELIHDLKVGHQVKLVSHPFLANKEIKYIWQQMDAGVQLCDQDQLSTAFTEPQLFGKKLLASKIPSYERFNSEFEVEVPLVKNDPEEVAEGLSGLINHPLASLEMENRRIVIQKHYRFERNMKRILSYLVKLQTF